ncbi:hypothetical protein ACX3T3_03885 [Actinotignum schaalii]|uniref:hypothetical protein n=1 Tax=Actinotignum TaxID=1653174 RepID=UPI00237D5E47|nr:hypothetical protein [Actinotignum sanguinis]MDE1552245.1 hypothetical protein [Actinotignum sanguinis]
MDNQKPLTLKEYKEALKARIFDCLHAEVEDLAHMLDNFASREKERIPSGYGPQDLLIKAALDVGRIHEACSLYQEVDLGLIEKCERAS